MRNKVILFLILICFLVINCGCTAHTTKEEGEALLRIHVRANGNATQDLKVASRVSDAVTQTLSSIMRNGSLDEIQRKVSEERTTLKRIVDRVLMENGESYDSKVRLITEFTPTQVFSNTIVKSGYYQTLKIDLGKAQGDDWWCLIYTDRKVSGRGDDVIYKSRVVDWWHKIFG